MNSVLQCLSATVPFTRFFTDGRWQNEVNMLNALGTKGELAGAFYHLLRDMWQGDLPYLTPHGFRVRSFTFSGLEITTDEIDW